ncbi:MAG: hypothetical protein ISS36_00625 [Candidatus Aenigmarchaeota archaeon]|nr:hypothetical protein [Candidatus Aenigmarchaeota archaeon]
MKQEIRTARHEYLKATAKRYSTFARDLMDQYEDPENSEFLKNYLKEIDRVTDELCTTLDDMGKETPEPGTDITYRNVDELPFPARCQNVFEAKGIRLITQLLTRSEKDLLYYEHFGPTSLRAVKEILGRYGLSLRE